MKTAKALQLIYAFLQQVLIEHCLGLGFPKGTLDKSLDLSSLFGKGGQGRRKSQPKGLDMTELVTTVGNSGSTQLS